MFRTLFAGLMLLAFAAPVHAATMTVPGPVTLVPLDVATVTTGATAVIALQPGNKTGGGWIKNPEGSAQPLCINELGTASGTVSSGSTVCIAAGATYTLTPSIGSVSVVSSDSAHPFAGLGIKQ